MPHRYIPALVFLSALFLAAFQMEAAAGPKAQPAVGSGSASSGSVGAGQQEPGGRGWLGVFIQNLTPDLASAMGLGNTKGVLISQVMPKGPAEAGGLRAGDVVLSLDGEKTVQAKDLAARVGGAGAYAVIRLEVLRRGKRLEIVLTLGKAAKRPPPTAVAWDFQKALGMKLADPGEDSFKKFFGSQSAGAKRPAGVAVVEVTKDGPAFKAGLRAGDVILEAGQKPCPDLAGFKAVMAEVKPGDKLLIKSSRRGYESFLVLKTKP